MLSEQFIHMHFLGVLPAHDSCMDLTPATNAPPMPLTTAEVALLLGVSERHVARLHRLDLLAVDPFLSDVAEYVSRRDAAARDVHEAVARVASTPTLELTEVQQRVLDEL